MITALTLAPIAAAILMFALPEARARMVALGGALVSLALTVFMLMRFDLAETGIQFQEKFNWIPALGIDYFVGLDGLNALVLLLAAVLAHGARARREAVTRRCCWRGVLPKFGRGYRRGCRFWIWPNGTSILPNAK